MADSPFQGFVTNQTMTLPVCERPATVAMLEIRNDPNSETLKDDALGFFEAVWKDFKMTNAHIGGKVAKTGASLLVGGAVAAKMGARTPLAFLRAPHTPLPYEFATKFGGGVSNLQWTTLSGGQRLGRVVMAAGTKFVLVTVAFEGGVLIGAVINQMLSEETKEAIGGTLYGIINEGGYKLLWEHPFGIGMK